MKDENRVLHGLMGVFLIFSLVAIGFLSYQASKITILGRIDSLIVLAIIFSIPAYLAVFRSAILLLTCRESIKEEKKGAVLAPQTTVEGILDQRTKRLLDKDGDGEIMISEFYPLTEKEVLDKILSVDEKFSKEDFYAWVKHLYSTILEALENNEVMMLRRFESKYLYQRHIALFQDIKDAGAHISNYAIKGVLLKDFKIDGDKEILVVALTAALNREINKEDNIKSYILTFSRKKGLKTTSVLMEEKETNCPNCGAVLDLDSYGVCSYCKTVINDGNFGWVLIDMKSIKLIGDEKKMN